MAALKVKSVLFSLTITCVLLSHPTNTNCRELSSSSTFWSGFKLEAVHDCWSALSKIRSCSNEIVAYFANGLIDISPQCCQAITLITHQCWSPVLGALGYSEDQTNVLRGYCDAFASYGFAVNGPVSSPVGQPIPAVNQG